MTLIIEKLPSHSNVENKITNEPNPRAVTSGYKP